MFQNYKNSDCKRGPLRFTLYLSNVFVLTCLRMAEVQAETCSIHVRVTS